MSQEIINYLLEGKKRGFTIVRLKEELLKNGFNQKDIDDAAVIVESGRTQAQPVQQIAPVGQVQTQQVQQSNQLQVQQVRPLQQTTPPALGVHPNLVKNHSQLLNSGDSKKSHTGIIITLIFILLLLIGGGVALWIFRDQVVSYLKI